MSEAINLPQKFDYSLIKFTFEGGSATYTDAVGNKVGPDGLVYLSTPDLELAVPPNSGTLDAKECTVDLPVERPNGTLDAFIAAIASLTPFAPTDVEITQYTRPTTGGPQTLVARWFKGRVDETVRNPEKRSDVVRFIAFASKTRLEVALGFQCNPECENALGDQGCKINLLSSSFSLTGAVTAIDGSTVTIVNPTVRPDRFYHRGFVSFQGLNIGIRDWRDSDPEEFILLREPPQSWIGQTVRFTAGCDKTPETCFTRFNNLANFLGFGRVVPSYNPLTKS